MNNPPIIVDPEFATLIPPLTRDEDLALTTSIRRDGCRDPLAVWRTPEGDVLLDGHNRYRICAFDKLPYQVAVVPGIANRDAAIDWMLDTQLGRRNLTPENASYLRGQRYNRAKVVTAFRGNQHTVKPEGQKDPRVSEPTEPGGDQNDPHQPEPDTTAERLAAEHKVSAPTIKRDGKYAAAVDSLGKAQGEAVRKAILAGDNPLPKQDILTLADASPEEQQAVLTFQSKEEMLAAAKELRERQAAERRQERANVAAVNENISDEEKRRRDDYARWKRENKIGRVLDRLHGLTLEPPEQAAALTVESCAGSTLFLGNCKDMADAGLEWLRQYTDHLARELGIPDNVRRLP